MSAEQEMDMQIAITIFGKDRHYYDCPHFDQSGRMLSFCGCPTLPRYSADIKAAWKILEEMKSDGGIEVGYDPIGGTWYAHIGQSGQTGFGTTAPIAICHAALLAKGYTK